jgi:hypothetical protein
MNLESKHRAHLGPHYMTVWQCFQVRILSFYQYMYLIMAASIKKWKVAEEMRVFFKWVLEYFLWSLNKRHFV